MCTTCLQSEVKLISTLPSGLTFPHPSTSSSETLTLTLTLEMEGEEGATSLLAWARSWFTPSVLFLLLNLIIGTIVATSKGIARAHRHHHHPEAAEVEELHHHLHRAPSMISRSSSSLLTRLRSIGTLSLYTSSVDIVSESAPPPLETDPDQEEEHDRLLPGPSISRSSSSFLTRLRSIGSLSRYTSGGTVSESVTPPPPETDPAEHDGVKAQDRHFGRSQSEGHPKVEEPAAAAARRMKKAASARSVADEAEDVGEVDAKADDFINRFRDQLRLQRLDSILRYTDMLNRGK